MKVKNIILRWLLMTTGVLLLEISGVSAQCFTSGSTAADGNLVPPSSMPTSGWSTNDNVVTVTNTADGIFNFGTISIGEGWIVKFTTNTLNTPIYLLATGDVMIAGTIDVSGEPASGPQPGIGGPGGYGGGLGTSPDGWGHGPGFGAACGAGTPAAFARMPDGLESDCLAKGNDQPYGTIDLVPMIGGSGGSGSSGANGGSGGGGAILIASSGAITVSGAIYANGGLGEGRGSGGAIKLMANTIVGEGTISALPADSDGTEGRIRLEACVNQRMSETVPPATFGTPGIIILNPNPTIQIVSIAGQSTPWPPAGRLTAPDMTVTNLPNVATISVSAAYITTGTTFEIIVNPVNGSNFVGYGTLSSGNYTLSSGSVYMPVWTSKVWRVNAIIPYITRP